MHSVFSDQNGIILQMNRRRECVEFTISEKNPTLLITNESKAKSHGIEKK